HEFAGGLSSESQNRMMLGEEACHARLGGKRADVAISVSIFGERKAGRRQTGAAGLRRIDHDQLRIGSERHRVRRRVVGVVVVSRVIASSMRAVRMRVEKAKPSLTGAGAFLMIAADEYPRCGGEQRRRRAEKIGVPRVPAIPPRTAFTARPTSGARVFPIVIIADVKHEIGLETGGGRRDAEKRPAVRIVAALPCVVGPLHPTTAVADDDPRRWHVADRRDRRRGRLRAGTEQRAGGRYQKQVTALPETIQSSHEVFLVKNCRAAGLSQTDVYGDLIRREFN